MNRSYHWLSLLVPGKWYPRTCILASERICEGSEATVLTSGRHLEITGISAKLSLVITIDCMRELAIE